MAAPKKTRSPPPGEGRLEIIEGDITKLAVDAIVNAANPTLLGGGGVDGAIHRAAGPRLREECRGLGGCATGEAKITRGYDLPARFVIHTVGPVWHGGGRGEDGLLARCYRNSLQLAEERKLDSVAFPAISTGAYGFPPERAARIALREALAWIAAHAWPRRIIFVCFNRAMARLYQDALAELG